MKKHEHQYVTGIITGAIMGFVMVLLAYWIVSSVSQGIALATMLLLVSCVGMLVGAAMSYLISQSEDAPHFVLKRR